MNNRQNNAAFFSENYIEARNKFIKEAEHHDGVITSFLHPEARAADGSKLFVDVACFGPIDSELCFLIISGTHGPEGFAGSAAQLGFMACDEFTQRKSNIRIVMIHAINPYGFSYITRTTENNVDLNRNFVDFDKPFPSNPDYLDIHHMICPKNWSDLIKRKISDDIDDWTNQHGADAWLAAVSNGQFDKPDGMFFGGQGREWSNITVEKIIRQELPNAKKVAFIDWHTGLGKPGEPFYLCFNEPYSSQWQRCCDWWGKESIEATNGFGGSQRPDYQGLLFYGVQGFLDSAEMAGAVIEFGTKTQKEMDESVRIDRWIRFGDHNEKPEQKNENHKLVKEAFCPDQQSWRDSVIGYAQTIQVSALKGLSQW